jgi:hypothetical protein
VKKSLLFAFLVLGPQVLNAQDTCTYDRCALRLEGATVVAGRDGAERYRLSPFSTPRLEERFAANDSALAHYRVFTQNHVSGNLWSMLGGLSLGFALSVGFDDDTSISGEVVIGTAVVGAVATLIGGSKLRRARKGLAQSIWWYNRDLPR